MTIITIATTTTAIEAGVTTTTQTITMMNAIVVTVGTTTGSMQTTVVGAGQSTEVVAGVQGADVEVTITVQRTGAGGHYLEALCPYCVCMYNKRFAHCIGDLCFSPQLLRPGG